MPNKTLLELIVTESGKTFLFQTYDQVKAEPIGSPKLLNLSNNYRLRTDRYSDRESTILRKAPEDANAYTSNTTNLNQKSPIHNHFNQNVIAVQYYKISRGSLQRIKRKNLNELQIQG